MLKKFIRTVKAKNRSKNTIVSIEQSLVKAEKALNKPLETATYEDILNYVELIKNKELAPTTIHIIESKFIQFYHFCFDETEDIQYNKMLKQLKNLIIDKPKTHIKPQDILLPEDIKKLINVATIERDRCIIAVLFESGMRIGELLALTSSMIHIDDEKQEVTFNVPRQQGCKTGERTVVCLEIHNYVQDWMKCNPSDQFLPMSKSGVSKAVRLLFEKAGIKKPCNIHMFRHSSITDAVNRGMQQNAISLRYWGQVNSNMLATYISLSEMMQAQSYRNSKGMGNGNGNTIINPLSVRCVECGKLIQSGSLCDTCNSIKKVTSENQEIKKDNEYLKKELETTKELFIKANEAFKSTQTIILVSALQQGFITIQDFENQATFFDLDKKEIQKIKETHLRPPNKEEENYKS